jgi:hypothetical protein
MKTPMMTQQERDRCLALAVAAHSIKPGVPLSWLWLLEWASGQHFFNERQA